MKNQLLIVICSLVMTFSVQARERIIDTRDGSTINRVQLLQVLSDREFILLGELHDNPTHHQHRGEILEALKGLSPTVVAEHMERGKTVVPSGNLQDDLEKAGFDAKGWRWPLHESMFQAALDANLQLSGGNITRDIARQAVREGEKALPPEIMKLILEAPIGDEAQAELDADLLRGHCGHLPENMLQGLRLAQRARDAAMYDALQDSPGGPAILLAGNGHVRLDYGVPSLIRQHNPDARYVSIGFLEENSALLSDAEKLREQFDYIWLVADIEREDPCLVFKQQ